MEVEQSVNVLSGSTLYSDDQSAGPRRSYEDDQDKPRGSSEEARVNGDYEASSAEPNPLDDSPPPNPSSDTQIVRKAEAKLLSLEETTELFRTRINEGRKDTEKAFRGSGEMDEAIKPKLTLDLGHAGIARLPEDVVDLIKGEVERLSLSHNQIWYIPPRFSECSSLRYLNIRSNAFREIPRGVYRLPLLEILDISRNKIRWIGKEIKNLTSLRVFSLLHNRVDDLPIEICEMTKLQIIKVDSNPLRFKLKKIVETKQAEVADLPMTSNEKDAAVTAEIKRHLRETTPIIVAPVDIESGGEFSEGPGDTPRPLRRALSSRFPVVPSTSSTSSETASDPLTRSPSHGRPPPIPTRSHARVASIQNGTGLRRPVLATLINSSNERNRSNSESVLQASMAARNKRMGKFNKEKSDLKPVDEAKSNRYSHLRGFSHGSVLRGRTSNIPSSPSATSSASPGSPRDPRRQRLGFIKRLSSLPEHKQEDERNSPIIDGAKGILYALYQVHSHIAGLVASLTGKHEPRSSLELTFYNASTHFDRLNEAIEAADCIDEEDDEALDRAEGDIQRDCATCIMAYTHVTAQLQDNIRKVVSGTDGRYLRTLMLLLYGSTIEIKNAILSFGVDVQTSPAGSFSIAERLGQSNPSSLTTPEKSVRATTPTRDRNLGFAKQGGRLRSDTTIQHPVIEAPISYLPNPPFVHEQIFSKQLSQPSTPLTGTTLQGGSYHKSNPSGASNGSQKSGPDTAVDLRSRSNSRATNYLPSNSSSLAPSIASTPHSGEVFQLPLPSNFPSKVNPVTGLTDAQEEAIFELIFLALTRAYDSALQMIPIAKRQFIRCLEVAEENRAYREVRELWSTLIWRCKVCLDTSETLKTRLVNMRLKDPVIGVNGAGSGRNDPAFWQLCKTFMQNFVELAIEMKETRDLKLLPAEIIAVLRPVQKASREAGKLIETSPWRHLADATSGTGAVQPPTSNIVNGNSFVNGVNGVHAYPAPGQPNQLQQSPFPPPVMPPAPTVSNGTNAAVTAAVNGASPVSVALPATPLSAALGPAAQATVPSTPGIGSGEQFFQGNVFQRADALLSSMQQAGNMGFLTRR